MRRVLPIIILLLTYSGLAWADTFPEGICGKLPIGSPKGENQPAFRLGCERTADGGEQIQLLIDGEEPLVLAGVDGESLGSAEILFDPASVIVRLLEGPPNLYWIQYGHRRTWEVGHAEIDYRRHWVVPQGNSQQTLFDEWVTRSYASRGGVRSSTWEDIALTYREEHLRVVETTSGTTYFDPELYGDETCALGEVFCEDRCGDLDGGKARFAESCVAECRDGKGVIRFADREYRLKTSNDIAIKSGQVSLGPTVWTRQFWPRRYTCAEPTLVESPVRFLVRDDGVAAWLVVRDKALLDEGEDLPKESMPDPGSPAPIPAVAACWLYNRAPWNEANSTRAYPPAPPEQVRPPHFVPEDCCQVETFADGHRTFVYETVKEDQPGRLLAIFDHSSQSCHSANLAEDGRWGKALLDWVGDPVFSPDGGKLGYRAKQGKRWFVVVDDRRGPEFDRVSSPVFSPDSQRLAYWAKQAKKEFIMLDDQPGPAFDGTGFPIFSPDSRKIAYRIRDGQQWFVMVGDEKGPAFDDIGYYTVPDTGRGSDIADVVFSPKGEFAYAARRGAEWFIVRDRRPGRGYEQVGLPVYSPDGDRLAFRARRDDREFIVLDEQQGPDFDFVGTPVFSPDGREVTYWAQQGAREFVMHGEHRGPEFAAPDRVGAPVFDRDGAQVIYWARQGEKEFILSGERRGPEFAAIEAPVLHSRTGQIAYRARQGNQEFVVLADRRGPEFTVDDSSRSDPVVFSPDGRQLAYRAKQEGKEFLLLGENKGPAFDEVGTPVFSPDGRRLAYRARQGESWLMAVDTLQNLLITGQVETLSSTNLPLRKTIPRLIPHPIIFGGLVVGGSTKERWISIETAVPPDLGADRCRRINPEFIPPGLRYQFYSFDKFLGECADSRVAVCLSEVGGDPRLAVDFPGCSVKHFNFGIAAPWNALPRRPKVLKNHRDFAPIVRQFLDRKGFKQAPVRIEYVHGVDLDGDGAEERIIHARSEKWVSDHANPNDYSLLLLVSSVRGKTETTTIEAWWAGDEETKGPYEIYDSTSYADANGDGIMEIFIDWRYYEGGGIRVYTLRDGKPIDTELGFFDGL